MRVCQGGPGLDFMDLLAAEEIHFMPAYKRILLKLSGEALMGDDAYGINRATIVRMVREIQEVTLMGCEVAIVIGGGNIFRGVAGGSVGMDRATADYMGMLATVMNALALAHTMRQEGMTARVMSAISIEPAGTNLDHWTSNMPKSVIMRSIFEPPILRSIGTKEYSLEILCLSAAVQ